MTHKILTYLLCIAIVFAPGCSLLTEEQRQSARDSLAYEYEQGRLTEAEYQATMDALDRDVVDWEGILTAGGSVIASILLGVPIAVGAVQRKRGPTEFQRRSAAQSATATAPKAT